MRRLLRIRAEGETPATPADGQPAADPQITQINDRLNSLIQAQETDPNAAILDRLGGLETALVNLVHRPAPVAPTPAASGGNLDRLLGKAPPSPTDPTGSVDLKQLITDTVQQAIAPVIQQTQESAAAQQLTQQHTQSFNRAIQGFPELADANSSQRQLFNKLFDGRGDIAALPDAPAIVAEMVRGLTAGQAAEIKDTTIRKQQASAQPPAAGRHDILGQAPGNLEKLKELKGQLQQKAETTGLEPGGFVDLVKAALTEKVTEHVNQQ